MIGEEDEINRVTIELDMRRSPALEDTACLTLRVVHGPSPGTVHVLEAERTVHDLRVDAQHVLEPLWNRHRHGSIVALVNLRILTPKKHPHPSRSVAYVPF